MPIKEWLDRLNNPMFDEGVAKDIVHFLYSHAEGITNTNPEIWFCESEYQAQVLANIIYQNEETRDKNPIVKKIKLSAGQAEYFRKNFTRKLKRFLKEWLKTDYVPKSCTKVCEILCDYIVGPKTDAEPIKINLSIIENSLEIFNKANRILTEKVLPYYFSTPVYGTDADFMWLNKYEESREKEGQNKTIEEYLALVKKCSIGALLEFDNICFVCRKTTENHFSEDGLMLHNPKGPSCRNLEGKECHHVQNIYFDKTTYNKFFPMPDDKNEPLKFTFADVNKITNAEQRQAIIKTYGLHRILGGDIEKLATDKRMEYSVWLKKPLPNYLITGIKIGNNTFGYLILTDPSDEEVFSFLVPEFDDEFNEKIDTVWKAKRWQFHGIDPDSYAIES